MLLDSAKYCCKAYPVSRVQQVTDDRQQTDRRICDGIRRRSSKKQWESRFCSGDGVLGESGSDPHRRYFAQLKSLGERCKLPQSFWGVLLFTNERPPEQDFQSSVRGQQ